MREYLERITALPPEKLAKLAEQNPLSYGQQRLWLLHLLDPESPVYNIPVALRLEGRLDLPSLRRAFDEITQRHESLRTTFPTIEGRPLQLAHPENNAEIALTDLSFLSENEREQQAHAIADREASRPFDLGQGPLFRVGLMRLAEQDHVLLITMHHIITDGWSSGILLRELSELYNAFHQGLLSPLAEPPVQFGDYALWEREWLKGEVVDRQLEYWKGRLSADDEPIELPVDRTRPPLPSSRGARRRFQLQRELSEGLKRLTRENGATLFMGLLAAFKILLSKYSRQSVVRVGTAVANRRLVESESAIGFFVNTVVVRTDLEGAEHYLESLRRVKEAALGAYEHQELPFERLVEALNPERTLSSNPLFQVAFDLQSLPAAPPSLTGLRASMFEVEHSISKFDLSLSIVDAGDELSGSIQYNTDLFNDSTIVRMIDHFQILLRSVVADPFQSLKTVPLMRSAERDMIVKDWNRTERVFDGGRLVHEIVDDLARLQPCAAAIVTADETITYEQLERRSNQLARYLRKQGVGPERIVGVCDERGVNLLIGLLGVLKAGGAYLPMDPLYPAERLAYMVEDANVRVILTQRKLGEIAPGQWKDRGVNLIYLDADWGSIEQESGEPVETTVLGENLAYVIYTSGSTGRPKGVEVEHRRLLNLISWHHTAYKNKAGDRVTQLASPGFDASVWEIWSHLTAGVTFYIPDDMTRASSSAIKDYVISNSITHCFLPTALAELAIKQEWPSECRLKALMTGGDKLTVGPRPDLPFEVSNLYGPTECAVVATAATVAPGAASHSIGKPISNARVYLLDPHMAPAPIGVGAELYVGGEGLARGYLNRPDLTAERFLPDPFSEHPGARVYRTGDLTRYLPDGSIDFLGRIDNQVKIGGYRIELGEIEAQLALHPGVREAVVVAREATSGEKQLVAYLGTGEAAAPSPTELRAFLREKLPEYMIPSIYVTLERLPQTANGKIDRKGLPAPDRSQRQSSTQYLAPATQMEQKLAAIWRKALNLDQISVDDNFFDLGGHSLLAVRIQERISKEIKPGVPLLKLFQYTTVRTLSEFLGADQESDALADQKPDDWAEKRKQALGRQRKMRSVQ